MCTTGGPSRFPTRRASVVLPAPPQPITAIRCTVPPSHRTTHDIAGGPALIEGRQARRYSGCWSGDRAVGWFIEGAGQLGGKALGPSGYSSASWLEVISSVLARLGGCADHQPERFAVRCR